MKLKGIYSEGELSPKYMEVYMHRTEDASVEERLNGPMRRTRMTIERINKRFKACQDLIYPKII